MSFSTCPLATIHAPIERVWCLLSDPSCYAAWWEAQTRVITPDGAAQVGQTIYAQARALGRPWAVRIRVELVDEVRHQIALTTLLPLGITVHNHIACSPLDPAACRVTFGRDFSISPGRWAWGLERFGSRQLHNGVAAALARLKGAAEKQYNGSP